LILYFLTATAIITAVYAALQREANHSQYVILLSLAIAFFALGSQIVLTSGNADAAFTGFRIQHIGQPFIGGIWFLYSLDICGSGVRKRSVIVVLMALPVLMALGVTMGDPLGLFVTSLSYEQSSGFLPYITGSYTQFYNAGLFHIYGFNILSCILVFHRILRPLEQNRTRLLLHFFAGLLPALIGIAAIAMDIPYKREAISTVLCISSVILNLYLLKTGAFRIVAKAKYQLFESVQDGIVIVNKHDGYMDSNDKARQIFPALENLEQGAPITGVEGFAPFFSQDNGRGNRFTISTGDNVSHYTITRSELLEDDRYVGSTLMIYDVTDTVEKEIAEKSSRTRSEFLSRMSHEMRTPMNAIMGMTALAKNVSDSGKRNDMLDKINDSSCHLLSLIDDVLEMAEIEDDKLHLVLSEFNFTEMLHAAMGKISPEVMKKRQILSSEIDSSIPETLISDERRFSQVILNLLSNAVKFTPEGGAIHLNAFVLEVEGETLTVQIEVIDSGIGITEEQRKKLYIPFEQIDGGIDRKFGGTGLGLSICKHIVGLMGGEIIVESEPGKGSKFSFTAKTRLMAPASKDDGPISLAGKSILLVEDMEINRFIVMTVLEDTGLRITCAENGLEALTLFTGDPGGFDAIIMDINMPEMDGVEATRRIRASGTPEGERIPIIAMTANVLASDVETYIECGMNDHVGKPVDYEKLIGKLRMHLKA